MAKKTRKDNRNLIIGVCSAVVVLVVVIVAVVLATGGSKLNDDYFKSDDTKYVLSYETENVDLGLSDDEAVMMPVKTHVVYTYSGDKITGMKTYAEYADADAAKAALDKMKEMGDEDAGKAVIDGKYIVMTNDEEDYKDTTVSDVKRQAEVLEMLKNMNLEDDSTSDSEYDDSEYDDSNVVETDDVEVDSVDE